MEVMDSIDDSEFGALPDIGEKSQTHEFDDNNDNYDRIIDDCNLRHIPPTLKRKSEENNSLVKKSKLEPTNMGQRGRQSKLNSTSSSFAMSSPISSASSTPKSSRSNSPRPKRYICNFPDCGKAYSRPSLLDQHFRKHCNERPFKCDQKNCTESFFRKDHLQRHQLKHLSDLEKPFHCSICGKGVNTNQHLKRHEKTHSKSFICSHDGCEKSFYKHQSLKAHIRADHENGKDRLKCKYCAKIFTRPGRLNDHIEKMHGETSKLICEYPGCFKTFKVWSALQLHVKTDHPRLECTICGKRCVGPSGLDNHMKIHNDDTVIKLWKCSNCDAKFHKKEDAVKHFAVNHPLLPLPEELQYQIKDENTFNKAFCQTDLDIEISYSENNDNKLKEENCKLQTTSESLKYNFPIAKPTKHNFAKQQKNRYASSPDAMDLIFNNLEQRLKCKYKNCHRLFRKNYDLKRHLEWHEKLDEKLDQKVDAIICSLESNQTNKMVMEYQEEHYDKNEFEGFESIGTKDITKLKSWESFSKTFNVGEEEKEDQKLDDQDDKQQIHRKCKEVEQE